MEVDVSDGVEVSVAVVVAVGEAVGVGVTVAVGGAVGIPGVILAGGAKVTVQPGVLAAIGLPFVSVKVTICSPSTLDDPAEPIALNVTRATLISPVGDVRLVPLNAEIRVIPLANVAALVTGPLENSAVVPPAIEAMDTTVWS